VLPQVALIETSGWAAAASRYATPHQQSLEVRMRSAGSVWAAASSICAGFGGLVGAADQVLTMRKS